MATAAGMQWAKRVTDPLDDKVKASLLGDDLRVGGYVSSGSEHEGGELSGFVDGIFFSDEENAAGEVENGEVDSVASGGLEADEGWPHFSSTAPAMVRDLVKPGGEDLFRAALAAHAAAAAERLAALRPNRAAFTRAIMTCLRDSGYNAGVCKARWETRGGITGGNYEYIDVISEESHQNKQRYILEADFREEFEIARPTGEYERILEQLPRVYVGKTEDLKRIIRLLGDAAKRSLQSREMHVPPWRKGRYMQTKWLGAYRRTTNPNPWGSTVAPVSRRPFTPVRDVKCRLVGFDAPPALPYATSAR